MKIRPALDEVKTIAAAGGYKLLEQYGTAAPEQIGAYVKRMKDAVRG